MELLPLSTGFITEHDDVVEKFLAQQPLQQGDIIAISAKVIAYTEGAKINLRNLTASKEAIQWDEQLQRSSRNPEFRQAILDETARMNGRVIDICPQVMLCELAPEGMNDRTILAVNAGLDMSNIEPGFAIGWPIDPASSVSRIQREITERTGLNVGVLITDSCCHPRRWGVGAMALAVAGFDPIVSQVGKHDLFGHSMTMTSEAVADQLATATNYIMGNINQAIPAVVIRGHNLPITQFIGWVPGMSAEEDMFQGMFRSN